MSSALLTPANEADAMSSPPPIELKKADNPLEEVSPAPTPSPRKSRVRGLLPYRLVERLIIDPLKTDDSLEESPSLRPDASELISSFTPLVQCDGVFEDDVADAIVEALT